MATSQQDESEAGVESILEESSRKTKEAVKNIDSTLASAEVNLVSIRETLDAIDNFQARWQVGMIDSKEPPLWGQRPLY